jgi:hypothetical protein
MFPQPQDRAAARLDDESGAYRMQIIVRRRIVQVRSSTGTRTRGKPQDSADKHDQVLVAFRMKVRSTSFSRVTACANV